jgi:integrase
MRWNEINLKQGTWTIPETKNGESQIIPLSEQVLEILLNRLKEKENQWVFPSKLSKSGHLEEPKSAWKRILKRADIENLRVHDLRRTLGSWQASAGISSYIIGKSLGHKDAKSTAVYARLHLDPVREAVGKANDAILLAAKVK